MTEQSVLLEIGLGACAMMKKLRQLWEDLTGKSRTTRKLPKHVFVLRGDTECFMETAKLLPGDTLLVYPGERVPVDGIIVEGESLLDAVETKEVEAVCRGVGETVYSGSLNRSTRLKIEVLRPPTKSFFQRRLAKATLREALKARGALLLPCYRADEIGSFFPGDLFM